LKSFYRAVHLVQNAVFVTRPSVHWTAAFAGVSSVVVLIPCDVKNSRGVYECLNYNI